MVACDSCIASHFPTIHQLCLSTIAADKSLTFIEYASLVNAYQAQFLIAVARKDGIVAMIDNADKDGNMTGDEMWKVISPANVNSKISTNVLNVSRSYVDYIQ